MSVPENALPAGGPAKLTQNPGKPYAADRRDGRFAAYFDGRCAAVHRLVDLVLAAAAPLAVPVSVCGLHAGSPNQAARYVRQGVRCISTEAASLLAVKARLLEEDLTAPPAAD